MKVYIPHLVVLTNQPMGCMFPTEDYFRFTIGYYYVEVMEHLISIFPKPLSRLNSLEWDSRKIELPVVLQGDEDR